MLYHKIGKRSYADAGNLLEDNTCFMLYLQAWM